MIRLDLGDKHHQRRGTFMLGTIIVGVMIGLFIFFAARPQPATSNESETAAATLPTISRPTPASAISNFVAIQPAGEDVRSGVEVGQPAPDFTLDTLDGNEVSLADYQGQPVLINFWASWCPPCRLEMPDLVRIYETYKDEGFMLLAIDLTFQDTLPDVEAFVKEFGMTFPVLLDYDGTITNERYRLLGLPMSVFVNREGIVTRTHIGAMTGDQIDEFVGEILE